MISVHNFAHAMTVKLLCHVHKWEFYCDQKNLDGIKSTFNQILIIMAKLETGSWLSFYMLIVVYIDSTESVAEDEDDQSSEADDVVPQVASDSDHTDDRDSDDMEDRDVPVPLTSTTSLPSNSAAGSVPRKKKYSHVLRVRMEYNIWLVGVWCWQENHDMHNMS